MIGSGTFGGKSGGEEEGGGRWSFITMKSMKAGAEIYHFYLDIMCLCVCVCV